MREKKIGRAFYKTSKMSKQIHTAVKNELSNIEL